MDYLDTFDVDSTNKKCHRVRSWYLYEQYRSLERNQLDAAQLLKSKSYQNNILRQELKERRARRKLSDQYGLCQSESRLDRSIKSCPSASTDDLFESLCELHEENEVELKECCSYDGSQTSINNDDINEIENKTENFSDSESIQSVIDKDILKENLAHNVKEELEIVKKNIAKNITLQLETVKENIDFFDKFTKNNKVDLFRNKKDLDDKCNKKVKNKTTNIIESLFSIWSNLVVFANDSVQFNHGNCYYQCSSQLLTAVLACDFLRRGVDAMCHILQSYVSPIKYATSDSETSVTPSDTQTCEYKKKKKDNFEKFCEIGSSKYCSCNRPRYKSTFVKRCCSENRYKTNYSSDDKIYRGASEPWRRSSKFYQKKTSNGKYINNSRNNLYQGNFSNKNHCKCHYLKDIVNPVLRVARYIENILQDLEETPVWTPLN